MKSPARIRREKITDYLLLTGLIAVSGFPFFMMAQIHFLILFLVAAFVYLKRSIPFDTRTLWILGVFVVLETLQFLFIKPFDPVMISGTLIRIVLSMLIMSLLCENIFAYYVDILCFFSFLSFLFYLPSLLIPGFFSFFTDKVCSYFTPLITDPDGFYIVWPTNILFCFHECIPLEFRNPGPFWEPGLFAVFLNLALLFNFILEKKIATRKNLILLAALATTMSTAGYIAFFVLLFSFYLTGEPLIKKILLSVILLPLLGTLYFSVGFLNDKVETNIQMAGTTTSSRFGSALIDLHDYFESPWIGWGRGVMRYGGRSFAFFSEDQHRNNSITDLLATYGTFLFLVFFYHYYRSLRVLCESNSFPAGFAAFALVVILLLGFSQSIFMKPFFYGILFIHYACTYPVSKSSIASFRPSLP